MGARRHKGVLDPPFQASGACTRDRFVTQTGEQTVVRTGTAGQRAAGVAQADVSADEATKGKSIAVQVLGYALVEAGAAVALGDRVMSDNVGRAVPVTATNVPLGIAANVAGAAGTKIGVLLTPGLPAEPA